MESPGLCRDCIDSELATINSGVRMADCSRKRLRFCEHCGKEVTYPVYKKRKEEFYDYHKKEWKLKYKSYAEEVDAEDNSVIRDVDISTAVYVTGFEKSRLPRTQQQDTLFTIEQ